MPRLFHWNSDADLIPCPLHGNYQLVRNVLAAGVKADGTVSTDGGHVLLIYEERNPAVLEGGNCLAAYLETRAALREPGDAAEMQLAARGPAHKAERASTLASRASCSQVRSMMPPTVTPRQAGTMPKNTR